MSSAGSDAGARRESSTRIAWLLFAFLFVSYAYFFQGGGWNPNSRLDLTRAIVERRTLAIDAYRENTGDWAHRNGHFYTNKAPGLSFVSAPFYALASAAVRPFAETPKSRVNSAAYLTTVAVNGVASALAGVLLFTTLSRLGISSARARAGAVLAFGLGTLAFPYATAYYGHQLAAAASFASFAALLTARGAGEAAPRRTRLAALGGAAIGLAVFVEHSVVLTAVLLGAVLASDARGRALLPAYVAGGLPVAVLLGLYNASAFGEPFSGGFAYANPSIEVRVEGALFGWPPASRLWELLFSGYRGLFATSPLLALAPLGAAALFRADRQAAFLGFAVPIAFLLFAASFHAWHGGFAPGPRYLVPALPFLCLPAAFGLVRFRVLGSVVAGVSVACMLAITSVGIEIPPDVRNPLLDVVVPFLQQSRISFNTYSLDSFDPVPIANDMSSFNLGELLWPAQLWSLAPLLVVWAVLGAAILRATRGSGPETRGG